MTSLDSALENAINDILHRVEPRENFLDRDQLETLFEGLRLRFAEDYQRVEAVSDLLYGDDITGYGERTASVFSRWEDEGGGPSLLAFVSHAAQYFGLDNKDPVVTGAYVSAVLAEYPNDLQYHGNEHYRKVLFHSIRLAVTHNTLSTEAHTCLTRHDLALLLTASCIHDLGHKGGDNMRDGVYTPGYLEQRAFDIAAPYLEACSLNREDLDQIQAMVFCTDITFQAGDNSPCIRMRSLYDHYVNGMTLENVGMLVMGKLRPFEDNPKMALMAMLLHEADIATSAGLSYERTVKETIDIMEEAGSNNAGPAVLIKFIQGQLGGNFYTEAGRALMGETMQAILENVAADLGAGRTSY